MLFSESMKAKRKQLRLSQKELSNISGVPQSTISAVETGARTPNSETMIMIARGLGCTVSELLGESSSSNEKKPTAVTDDGLKDEIIELISQLPEDQLPKVRDFAAWLKSRPAE